MSLVAWGLIFLLLQQKWRIKKNEIKGLKVQTNPVHGAPNTSMHRKSHAMSHSTYWEFSFFNENRCREIQTSLYFAINCSLSKATIQVISVGCFKSRCFWGKTQRMPFQSWVLSAQWQISIKSTAVWRVTTVLFNLASVTSVSQLSAERDTITPYGSFPDCKRAANLCGNEVASQRASRSDTNECSAYFQIRQMEVSTYVSSLLYSCSIFCWKQTAFWCLWRFHGNPTISSPFWSMEAVASVCVCGLWDTPSCPKPYLEGLGLAHSVPMS